MSRKPAESRLAEDGTVEKKCGRCGEFKRLADFPKSLSNFMGTMSKCRECNKEVSANWYARNKEDESYREKRRSYQRDVYDKDVKYEAKLKYKYGLTKEEYYELAKNGCMICGTIEDLAVDHNHETNKTRGILCRNCNKALGLFGDNVENLLRAAAYLEEKGTYAMPGIRPSEKLK